MMKKAAASSPASLSFIFRVCPNDDLTKMGSIGVGCTLDQGVKVEVKQHPVNQVLFNHSPIQIPTVDYVVKTLSPKPLKVQINSTLPLGFGFGISSAASLACALAINHLFNLRKTKLELAKIAHVAEIVNLTGLGSVTTQITGGFLIKKKPGIPASPADGRVRAQQLPFIGKKLYAIIVDKLETPSILQDKNYLQKINRTAEFYLSKIKKTKNISLTQIIDFSYEFSLKTGLIQNQKVKEIIEYIRSNGEHACMAILGHVVITDRKPNLIQNYPTYELTITKK